MPRAGKGLAPGPKKWRQDLKVSWLQIGLEIWAWDFNVTASPPPWEETPCANVPTMPSLQFLILESCPQNWEVKQLGQGHVARKDQKWDWNSGLLFLFWWYHGTASFHCSVEPGPGLVLPPYPVILKGPRRAISWGPWTLEQVPHSCIPSP